MIRKILATTLAAFAMSGAALAHEPGDIIVRGGLMYVSPDVDSSEVTVNGTPSAGSKVEIPHTASLFNLSGTWMAAPHLGIELAVGGPYAYDLKTKGVINSPTLHGNKLAEVTQQPITASVQLFFLPRDYRFQPYVGVGLNYTSFYDERFKRRQRREGWRRLEIDDSWGLALQAGFDFMITKNWLVNASAWRLDVDTEAKGRNRRTHERLEFDVDVDPWMYFVGVGYKF
ncbi:MAG: outer membrane beta-barrel protein [Azoarcus sp.]|jgi:outer membrane protein|nr:outer membrane beta-barrel protein [Azoarcus sp.]